MCTYFIVDDVRFKLSVLVRPLANCIIGYLKIRLSVEISYQCILYCPEETRYWRTHWAYSSPSRSHVSSLPYWSITGPVPRCRRSKSKCKYVVEWPTSPRVTSVSICTMVVLTDGFVFRKNLPEYGVSKKINDLGHITFNLDADILFHLNIILTLI